MAKLGVEGRGGPARLAREIGMPPYGDNNGTIRKWLRGDHAPRAEYLLEMLSRAGLLTAEADRAWRGAEAGSPAARAAAEAERARRDVAEVGRAAQARRKRGTG